MQPIGNSKTQVQRSSGPLGRLGGNCDVGLVWVEGELLAGFSAQWEQIEQGVCGSLVMPEPKQDNLPTLKLLC